MRVFVFLYSTNKRGTRMSYTALRNHLEDDGFNRLVPEVYMRVVASHDAVEKHRKRLIPFLPSTGTVLFFTMTEKQYREIDYLVGKQSPQETLIGANNVITL